MFVSLQSILYKQIDVTKVPVDVVLDRDKLSADGSIELDLYAISEDGSLIGYCTSKDGSKWNTIRIRNVETLKDYEDELHYVRSSSISWRHDNSGFFYSVCNAVLSIVIKHLNCCKIYFPAILKRSLRK